MSDENQNLELPPKVETEKLKTENKSVLSKKKNGGAREGSGRKPKIPKELLPDMKKFEARIWFNQFFDKNLKDIEAGLKKHIKRADKFILDKMIEQRIGKAPVSLKIGGDEDNNAPINVVMLPPKK